MINPFIILIKQAVYFSSVNYFVNFLYITRCLTLIAYLKYLKNKIKLRLLPH